MQLIGRSSTVVRAALACLLLPVLGMTAFAGTAAAADPMTGQASPTVALGGSVSDTVTFNTPLGLGNVTFRLYGPDDADCSGTPVFTNAYVTFGVGDAFSNLFAPTTAGTYIFTAHYVDQAAEFQFTTSCNDPAQSVVVTQAVPAITTQASASVDAGGEVYDVATLTGGSNPTGIVNFKLYGPDDADCSGTPVFIANSSVGPSGVSTSASYPTVAAGTYRWVASYYGDDNNLSVSGACNDAQETVTVTVPPPVSSMSLTNTPSPASRPAPGGSFTFAVVVTNTGETDLLLTSLVDDVYGDLNGQGTCAVGATMVQGDDYTCTFSGPFDGAPGDTQTDTVTAQAVVSDDCVPPLVPGGCLALVPGATASGQATVTTTAAVTTLSTEASDSVPAGFAISDTAFLSNGYGPTGTITFRLYGPNDATCSGAAIASSVVNGAGNGIYEAEEVTIALPGTYRWIASYSGDIDNLPVTGACNDADETVEITPSIAITNSPNRLTRVAPGGTFTFAVTVLNSSTADFEVLSLVDDVYGDLNGKGTCVVPQMVVAGDIYNCHFTGDFIGVAGDSQTNTVTVTARPLLGLALAAALAPVGNATAAAATTLSLTGPPAAVQVSPAVSGGLASTGSDIDRLGLLGTSLMLLGGLTLVATRRRRIHP